MNLYIHSTKMSSLEDYESNASPARPRDANQPHVTKETKIMKMSLTGLLAIATCAMLANLWTPSAEACGGFFCTSVPVDQNAERIIFTQNGDGTVSAYVQIEYTGAAPDFSWILPLPKAIPAEAIEVPEDAMAAFRELEAATTPVFIPPELPEMIRRAADVHRIRTVRWWSTGVPGRRPGRGCSDDLRLAFRG